MNNYAKLWFNYFCKKKLIVNNVILYKYVIIGYALYLQLYTKKEKSSQTKMLTIHKFYVHYKGENQSLFDIFFLFCIMLD